MHEIHKIVTSRLTERNPSGVITDPDNTRGFIARIIPPVQLNPEVVRTAIINGSFDPEKANKKTMFTDAALIGHSDEATVIYARLERPLIYTQGEQNEFNQRIAQLLCLLGIDNIVHDDENPPVSSLV